jgi:hypothetical protein
LKSVEASFHSAEAELKSVKGPSIRPVADSKPVGKSFHSVLTDVTSVKASFMSVKASFTSVEADVTSVKGSFTLVKADLKDFEGGGKVAKGSCTSPGAHIKGQVYFLAQKMNLTPFMQCSPTHRRNPASHPTCICRAPLTEQCHAHDSPTWF